jgi:transcriptional regulator with GAF, ATPase, and Fis domain
VANGVAIDSSTRVQDGFVQDGLVQELADLTRVLVGELDGAPLTPERVVQFVARAVPHAEDAALTIIRGSREPETLASSSEVPRKVDALQYETGEGPCLEALEENDITRADDLTTDGRWPQFAARAVALTPVRSMLGARLFLSGDDRGALNLYATRPNAFDDLDVGTAAILSTFASVALQWVTAERKVENLEVALESSRQIGAAMGILMARKLVTKDQAFELLKTASQHLHRKLRDIAAEVIETGEVPSA